MFIMIVVFFLTFIYYIGNCCVIDLKDDIVSLITVPLNLLQSFIGLINIHLHIVL